MLVASRIVNAGVLEQRLRGLCVVVRVDEEGDLAEGLGDLTVDVDEDDITPSGRRRSSRRDKQRISLADFTFIKVLGKGSFGKVTLPACSAWQHEKRPITCKHLFP